MESGPWPQPEGGFLAGATVDTVAIEFSYDGLSRRISKKTTRNGVVALAESECYLYHGWSVVMVSTLNSNGSHFARKWSCIWRPEAASSLYARSSWQNAGGVGGLAWLQTGIAQTAVAGTPPPPAPPPAESSLSEPPSDSAFVLFRPRSTGVTAEVPESAEEQELADPGDYGFVAAGPNAEVHVPLMDHMGNVRHYFQIKLNNGSATGQVSANLEYDAFGREVRAWGPNTPASGQPPGLPANKPWVDQLPFHFSTKLTDQESGLNYYGYRFYDALNGRWLSRDPIGELGGAVRMNPSIHYPSRGPEEETPLEVDYIFTSDKNLYMLVENNSLTQVDVLGLAPYSSCFVRRQALIATRTEFLPGGRVKVTATKRQCEFQCYCPENRNCPERPCLNPFCPLDHGVKHIKGVGIFPGKPGARCQDWIEDMKGAGNCHDPNAIPGTMEA